MEGLEFVVVQVLDVDQPVATGLIRASGSDGDQGADREEEAAADDGEAAARLTRLSLCGAVFRHVTVCELLGQILRRQPIEEPRATTTGGPHPEAAQGDPRPSDAVTMVVTASSSYRSPEDRLAEETQRQRAWVVGGARSVS